MATAVKSTPPIFSDKQPACRRATSSGLPVAMSFFSEELEAGTLQPSRCRVLYKEYWYVRASGESDGDWVR